MRRDARTALSLLMLAAAASSAHGQATADSALVAYIARIRAIDRHAHPMRPIPPGAPADTEFDALPLDALPPFDVPYRLRGDNPEWRATQRMLYGIRATDSAAFSTELKDAKARVRREQGERF